MLYLCSVCKQLYLTLVVADNCTESERQFIFILVKKSKNKDQNKQNYLIFETKMYISIAVFWFYFHSK